MKANDNDINQLTPDLIKAYNEGRLTAAQRNQVEQLMLENELYADAIDGLSQISELDKVLSSLDDQIDARLEQDTKTIFWTNTRRMAAVIMLLIVATVSYQLLKVNPDTKELAEQKSTEPTEKTELAKADSSTDNDNLFKVITQDTITEPLDLDGKTNADKTLLASTESDPETEFKKVVESEEIEAETDLSNITTLAKIEALPEQNARTLSEASRAERFDSIRPTDPALRSGEPNSVIGRVAGAPIKPSAITSISGTVFSDENGFPLSNVVITEKGTNNQISTTQDGRFTLPITQAQSVLSIKSEGYKAKEINANDTSLLSIVLEPEFEVAEAIVLEDAEIDSNEVLDPSRISTGLKALSAGDAIPSDREALPVNSTKAFDRYLKDSLQYPTQAREKRIRGRVIIEFTVLEDGSTSDHKIIKGLGYGCDQEAIRLIKEGPVWQPKIENGVPVKAVLKKTIRFRPK